MEFLTSGRKAPSCPSKTCVDSQTQHLGYAVMADHIIEMYVCHRCERTLQVRNDDTRDPRFREIRAEGPSAAAIDAAVPKSA